MNTSISDEPDCSSLKAVVKRLLNLKLSIVTGGKNNQRRQHPLEFETAELYEALTCPCEKYKSIYADSNGYLRLTKEKG